MCSDGNHGKTHLPALHRRQLLTALGALGVTMLAACGKDAMTAASALTTGTTSSDGTTGTTDSTTLACSTTESANETNGPFPADGTNTAGDSSSTKLDFVYSGTPVERSDLTQDGYSGVPLNLTISLQNVAKSCAIIGGYYIYIWHCTPTGVYSAYTATNNGGSHSRTEKYFRGIQQTDGNGQVNFQTIYPGWYSGRAIHIHAEVYRTLDDASPLKITQFAFPMDINRAVAAQTTYGYKGTSGMLDNSSDNIFSDGTSTEMLTLSTRSNGGYNASIVVRVSA